MSLADMCSQARHLDNLSLNNIHMAAAWQYGTGAGELGQKWQ